MAALRAKRSCTAACTLRRNVRKRLWRASLSCSYLTIKNVSGYDTTTYTGSIFSIGTAFGGIRSGWINIRNSGRKGGALAAGAYDVEASPDTEFILLENVADACRDRQSGSQ